MQIRPAEFDSQHGRNSPLTTWSCSAESLPPTTHKHLQNEAAVSLRTKPEQADKRLMWWRSCQLGPRLSLPVDVRSCISSVAICTPDKLITLSLEKPHVLTNFSPEKWKKIWHEQESENVVPPWSGPSSYRLAWCLLDIFQASKIMEEKTIWFGEFLRVPQSLRQDVKQPGHSFGNLLSKPIFIGPRILDTRSTDLHRHSGPALHRLPNSRCKKHRCSTPGCPPTPSGNCDSIIMHLFIAWINFIWGSYHEGDP